MYAADKKLGLCGGLMHRSLGWSLNVSVISLALVCDLSQSDDQQDN